MSLRWIDTDKGDADPLKYWSRLVVREIKKTLKKSDVPSAVELFSGVPPLESVETLLSLSVSHSQEEANSCEHFYGVLLNTTPHRAYFTHANIFSRVVQGLSTHRLVSFRKSDLHSRRPCFTPPSLHDYITFIFHFLRAHFSYFFFRTEVSVAIRTLVDCLADLPNKVFSQVVSPTTLSR